MANNTTRTLRRLITGIGGALPVGFPLNRGQIALKQAASTEDEVHILVRNSSGGMTWRRLLTETYADTLYGDIANEHVAVTVTDGTGINFTLTGQQITAEPIFAGTGAAGTVARSDHNHDTEYAAIDSGGGNPAIRTIASYLGIESTTIAFAGDGSCRAYYLGVADEGYTNIDVTFAIGFSPITSVTWAELGIGTSAALTALDDDADITTRGYTDIATPIQSTGTKVVSITVSGISAGDHLWLLLGYAADNNFSANRADDSFAIATRQTAAATSRPSTWSNPHAFTAVSTSGVYLAFKWIGTT